MLEGKAKDKFEEWFFKNIQYSVPSSVFGSEDATPNDFYVLYPSMQWGVIQDFADSLGHKFTIHIGMFNSWDVYHNDYCFSFRECKSRQEARTAAIEKLNELINKGL